MTGRSHPQCGVLRCELQVGFFAPLRLSERNSYNASMTSRLFGVFLVSVILLVSVTAKTQNMKRIPAGVWGGQHINIQVGEKSATIEYDCASGVIDGPLVVDANGNFNLRGTHRAERGGPVRANDDTKGKPATYTGSVKENTMTLTLQVGDDDTETFTLEKGKEGELFKCK
jgi:hypothetical protein